MYAMRMIALAACCLALAACGEGFKTEYIGQNLAGERYIDGECAPGYTLSPDTDRCIEVIAVTGDYDPMLDGITGRPCNSPLAFDVSTTGLGMVCKFNDGPRRVITVYDGFNTPTPVRFNPDGSSYEPGGQADWNEAQTRCTIWLRTGNGGSSAWQHELKHCRIGYYHT